MKGNPIIQTESSERGQSLVELAISLIVILFLLMGAVEFSLALFQYVTISDAAQEGAIYGSVNAAEDGTYPDIVGIQQRAIATASDVLILEPANITVSLVGDAWCEDLAVSGPNAGKPNSINVAITYDHMIFLPLVTPMIGTDRIHLTASVTNTIFYQCP